MMIIIGLFLLGNSLKGMITNTGAFEIYLDQTVLFSKLQSGYVPSNEDILMFIERRIIPAA